MQLETPFSPTYESDKTWIKMTLMGSFILAVTITMCKEQVFAKVSVSAPKTLTVTRVREEQIDGRLATQTRTNFTYVEGYFCFAVVSAYEGFSKIKM